MCGIAGIRRFDGAPVSELALRRMTARLTHRGPDDEGYVVRDGVGLGHRRLSIIDPEASQQPMADPAHDRYVCFNGEILNYRELRQGLNYPFTTAGDTETLLALFEHEGPNGVRRLRGQFAYGIYCHRTEDLWLFRDQLGVLPLYYYADRESFIFASEIKAILEILPRPPALDMASVGDYLARRSVPSPWTLYEGVRKLPPGTMLRIGRDGGVGDPVPYWAPDGATATDLPSRDEAVDELDSRLRLAVSRNLVADVPVGAYLSGGLDSSLIVSLVRTMRMNQPLHTFSATFGDPRFDETAYAARVSQHNDTVHHTVAVGADDFMRLWPFLAWHRDAPISEASDVAVFRLAEMASEHVKVVLSGEGSDELFGGYPKHRVARLTDAVGVVPSALRGAAARVVERRVPPRLSRMRIAIRALGEDSENDRIEGWFSPFTRRERERLLGGQTEHDRAVGSGLHGDPLSRMLVSDVRGWLVDNLLERGDRMTMAASVELRPPFLDLDLVEWALTLPSSLKIHGRVGKWLVREVAGRYLPHDIITRPKIGFRVPLDEWFRGDMRRVARRALLSSDSFVGGTLEPTFVADVLGRHTDGRSNEELRIWTLLSLEVWHRMAFGGDLASLGLGPSPVATMPSVDGIA